MKPYDSREDTINHIRTVQKYLNECALKLDLRAYAHDQSKLDAPEKDAFDVYTPKLKETTYGSPEYKQFLSALAPALTHHYRHNSHHPEHYENGVNGMSLFDVLEMLMDWKAASERHNDGDIRRSLEINKERFHIEPQLQAVLENTIKEMGW